MYFGDMGGTIRLIFEIGIAGLILAAVLYGIFALITRKKLPATMRTHIIRYIALTYILCVAYFTFLGDPLGRPGSGSANLIPFKSVIYAVLSGHSTSAYLLILNIIMFFPMGILLPLVFPKVNRLYKAILIAFSITLFIELIQYFILGRVFDIDDILMNILGAAIGYALYAVICWISKKRSFPKRTKIASIITLLILPVFLICTTIFVGAGKYTYEFYYNIRVPENIKVTATENLPETAVIYSKQPVDTDEIVAELMRKFDISGEIKYDERYSQYTVSEDDRELIFVNTDTFTEFSMTFHAPTKENTSLNDSEAEEFVKTKLKEYGLWKDGLVLECVEKNVMPIDETVTSWGSSYNEETGETVYDTEVYFPDTKVRFTTRNTSSIDLYNLNVTIDSDGVQGIGSELRQYSEHEEVKLMPLDRALSRFNLSHHCIMESNGIFEIQKAVFDHVEVVYVDDDSLQYRLPAYKLEGKFYGNDLYSNELKCEDGYLIIGATT